MQLIKLTPFKFTFTLATFRRRSLEVVLLFVITHFVLCLFHQSLRVRDQIFGSLQQLFAIHRFHNIIFNFSRAPLSHLRNLFALQVNTDPSWLCFRVLFFRRFRTFFFFRRWSVVVVAVVGWKVEALLSNGVAQTQVAGFVFVNGRFWLAVGSFPVFAWLPG